jgi:hypothetical protein
MRVVMSVLLPLGAVTIAASAEGIPPHFKDHKEHTIKANIRRATDRVKSDHNVHTTWPEHRDVGTIVRSPKPINSFEDLKTFLRTAPKTFLGDKQFGDFTESDGWFAASLDPTVLKESTWIWGVVVQKGSTDLYFFSHW